MPLDKYTCRTLPNCSIEKFHRYCRQENNLGRLHIIGAHILFAINNSTDSSIEEF